MASTSYRDRLFDEIAQWGSRAKNTFKSPEGLYEVLKNWTTPYETPERREEAMRLAAQQAKEQYMAQQNAGQLSLKDAEESQAIRESIGRKLQQLGPDAAYLAEQERLRMQAAKEGYMAQQEAARPTEQYQQPSVPGLDSYVPQNAALDPYAEYLRQNETLLMGPQGQYAAPTREEYQKYFVEQQAPPKAVLSRPTTTGMEMPVAQQAQPSVIPTLAEVPQESMASQQPVQQRPMTIKDRIAALPYEADRIDATRKVIEQARMKTFNDGLRHIAEVYGDIGLPSAENARKALEKSIDVNLPLPKQIEETAQYKSAEKNWDGGLRDRQKRLVAAYGVVKEAQNLMDSDPNKALRFMRSSMAKPLQSIISSDAIQVSEMLIQYEDLLNSPAFAQLTGKQPTNPAILYNKFLSLDDREKKTFGEKLLSAMVEANPQRALETAITTVNSYVSGYNNDINDQVINPTSPTIAKQLGAVQFKPLENRQFKNELPETYPQQAVSTGTQPFRFGPPPPGAVRIKQR